MSDLEVLRALLAEYDEHVARRVALALAEEAGEPTDPDEWESVDRRAEELLGLFAAWARTALA